MTAFLTRRAAGMLAVVVAAAGCERAPSGNVSPGSAPPGNAPPTAATALTADEITLLALASRPDSSVGTGPAKTPVQPPKLTAEEKASLLVRQFNGSGRGRRLATRLLRCDIFAEVFRREADRSYRIYAEYPAEMRKLASQAAGMALRGEDVPPPFSDEFRALAASQVNWVDRVRKSEALKKEILLEYERAYFLVTAAVDEDLTPAMGTAALPADALHVRPLPGGQALDLKYTGTAPLTNVVLLSFVTQTAASRPKGQIPIEAIDTFNRSFGATDEQADDARRLMVAGDRFGKMPKYASLYLPTLSPGDDVMFEVGFMERGQAAAGNTNTLALYCDQGRITRRDLDQYPAKPKPPRPEPSGPKPGERASDPDPGTGDKLYVGSVWRGKSTAQATGGNTIEQEWEVVVTARTGDAFRFAAYPLGAAPRPRSIGGTVRADGTVTLVGPVVFVPRLGAGKLAGDKLTFGPPPGQRPRNSNTSTLELTYVPPKQ
jgi:hypothetical protein